MNIYQYALSLLPQFLQDSVDALRRVFNRLLLYLKGEPFIKFKDDVFFDLCLPLWDVDNEGGIAISDGETVVPLLSDTTFSGNAEIVDATDFQYLSWNTEKNSIFKNCINLKKVGLKENTRIVKNMFEGCTSLENIKLPDIVDDRDWSEYAFLRCISLKEMKLPQNKTVYGGYCFAESGLVKIEFPDAVTHIKNYACLKCQSLLDVWIGAGIIEIGNAVFNTCPVMVSCYIKAISPPIITQYTFDNNTCNIYVPHASVNAYKTATNWSKYASRIYGYDFNNE